MKCCLEEIWLFIDLVFVTGDLLVQLLLCDLRFVINILSVGFVHNLGALRMTGCAAVDILHICFDMVSRGEGGPMAPLDK